MSKKMIRWGLLSTANINRRLIPAIQQSERGELTAVASRSEETAAAYAEKWQIPQHFSSYEAMLTSDDIDAVYIPLPNHLHKEWAIYAMRQGKHVLCEKPFALSLEDVDEMTTVAAETGMVLAEAFMYRHHPQTKKIGELVQNGRLGKIQRITASFSFQLQNPNNIRLTPAYGGGSLWDVGVYPVSLAQYVMAGLPKRVFASQTVDSSGVDVNFAGHMEYTNGCVAQISSSFLLPFYTQAEIVGTNGRLVLTRPFTGLEPPNRKIIFYKSEEEFEEIACDEMSLYLGEIEDMHAAILKEQPPYLTLAETRNHIQTVLALYRSAGEGRVIEL